MRPLITQGLPLSEWFDYPIFCYKSFFSTIPFATKIFNVCWIFPATLWLSETENLVLITCSISSIVCSLSHSLVGWVKGTHPTTRIRIGSLRLTVRLSSRRSPSYSLKIKKPCCKDIHENIFGSKAVFLQPPIPLF